jgi:ABC-type bacteriocin/lantibiotic exporter with double-glycine peptidase domain
MLWKYVFNVYYNFIKENPRYLFLNIFFLLVSVINNYYLPKYYGLIFDMFNKNINVFLKAFMYILIVKAVVYFISEVQNYYIGIQRAGLEININKNLIDKIKNKFIVNPNDVVIGENLAAISEFQSTISDWYSYIFDYIVTYVATIGFFLFYVSKYDYMMPVLILLFLTTSWYLLFSNATSCNNSSNTLSIDYLKKYQEVEDYLTNLLTIHTYNQYDEEYTRLKKFSKNFENSNQINNKCTLKWSLTGTLVSGLFLLSIMYRSFILLNKGKLTKSTFLSIYFIGSGILETLIYFSDTLHEMKRDYQTLKNIEKETKLDLYNTTDMQKPQEEIEKQHKQQNNTTNTINNTNNNQMLIKLSNISYKYNGSNQSIIDNFSMEIKQGERIALIGDIGSGKSTLIKIILGLLKPSDGDLFLNGINYKNLDQRDIFKRFGYMTQNPVLFNRSILENIQFGNPDVSRKEIVDLLERFKLNDVFNKLDKDIDTPVGKNGSKISGGQKQIIWFLRIYLQNPDILLMDEPTASLSPESKETLWTLIKEGFKGKTIIMSSHDDFLIKLATRKIKMKQ